MNGSFWISGWKRASLYVLLLLPSLALLFFRSMFSPPLLSSLFFVASLCALLALAIFLTPMNMLLPSARPSELVSHQISPEDREMLPTIPRALNEVLLMSPTEFEVFAAAVLIGMGEGYRFVEHCGQSGDQGIDVKLINLYQHTVVVQCKLYSPDNHIGQPELRDFLGSILFHKAIYGFFVTTSTFTPAARRLIMGTQGRIRPIDGQQLEWLFTATAA